MVRSGILKTVQLVAGGRCYLSTSCPAHKKVTVLGAGGGIGQPLSLLLKMNPLVSQLSLYDMVNVGGVAKDLQHCGGAPATVIPFQANELRKSLKGADLVVIPAGVPPKSGMSSDDNFNNNASVVSNLATAVAETCPSAVVAVISNPINSMVPVVAEILKQWNAYDPRKVFGVTSLNVERANYMIGAMAGEASHTITCPVIGGHAGTTIIPLFSRCEAAKKLDSVQKEEITQKIREGNDEVLAAKKGTAGPTLSMAYAASRFCNSVLLALTGEPNVVECTYVRCDITDDDKKKIAKVTETEYFASPVLLGREGIAKNMGLGELSDYERSLLPDATRELSYDIKRGVDYVKNMGKAGMVDRQLKDEMERRN